MSILRVKNSFLFFCILIFILFFPLYPNAADPPKNSFNKFQREEIQQALPQKAFPNQRNFVTQQKLPAEKLKFDLSKELKAVDKALKKNVNPLPIKIQPKNTKKRLPTVGFIETKGVLEVESGFKFIRVGLDRPAEETLSINYRISSNTAKEGFNYNENGKVEFKPGSTQVELLVEVTSPKTFFSTTHEIEIKLLPNPKVKLGENIFKQTLFQRGRLAIFTQTGNFEAIYTFAFLVFAWGYFTKIRTKIISPTKENSTADVLVTDEAVTNPEQDALGTHLLAKQLSLFLRNSNTKTPITLAITGQWGSGKSSIIGMLKKYLSDARHNPVWFNTWHHHGEEHLFGALLERIRQQAIPRFWTASGVFFRLKLFGKSIWDNPVLPILFAIPGITFFILGPSLMEQLLLSIEFIDHLLKFEWQALQIQAIDPNKSANGIFITIIGLYSSMKNALAPFGLQPEKLVREIGRSMDVIKFKTDSGLRYRVEKVLEDITWAHPLVIFIDDLDRCPPDQVLKVLEFVNFLSSGKLKNYIVLGMDLEKVLPSISSEFSKIVEESLKKKKKKKTPRNVESD